MNHLFIINPHSGFVKGREEEIIQEIHSFLKNYSYIQYDIHLTRWRRDAVGFSQEYTQSAKGMVRIYAVGGDGTLFEVINGVIGLPNVQVAVCSRPDKNEFIKNFGGKYSHLFSSFQSMVFADTVPVNVLRWGHHFGLNIRFKPAANNNTRVIIDGEEFFGTSAEYETIPDAIDIVHPGKIGKDDCAL